MEFFESQLLPYWPFFAFALVTGVFAQIIKTQVLTVEIARENKAVFWIRRVFPLALIACGAVAGATWPDIPTPGFESTTEKMWYFMTSACVSIAGFSAFRNWVKKKYDVELIDNERGPEPNPAPCPEALSNEQEQ